MSKDENLPKIDMSKNIDQNVNQPLLTVKEVATLLGETAHVIRNWLKELKTYVPITKSEHGYNLFDQKAVGVIRTIQRLHRDNGYSIKQIEHYLATGGEEFVPVSSPEAEEMLAKELREMKEIMRSMADRLDKQEDFNKALVKQLDEQQVYFESLLTERDRQLLHAMQEVEKKTLQLASAHEESKKKPWWKLW